MKDLEITRYAPQTTIGKALREKTLVIESLQAELLEANKEVAKQRRTIVNFGLSKYVEIEKELRHSEQEKECFDKRITELEQASEWISVEDRLPEEERQNLIMIESGVYLTSTYYEGEWYADKRLRMKIRGVTHWKPIHAPK